MDVLTRGLCFVPEKLEQLSRQVEALSSQAACLEAASAKKADSDDVAQLRQQFGKLSGTVVNKIEVAEVEHFNHLNAQLQALNALVGQKAEAAEVERVAGELRAVQDGVKAAAATASAFEAPLRAAGVLAEQGAARLAELKDGLHRHVEALQESLDGKAPMEKLQDLELAMAAKIDSAISNQIISQCRAMNNTLVQKAEWSEVEQLKAQLAAQGAGLASKVDCQARHDRCLALCRGLLEKVEGPAAAAVVASCCSTCGGACGGACGGPCGGACGGALPPWPPATEAASWGAAAAEAPAAPPAPDGPLVPQLQALRRLVAAKADAGRVEFLVEQFQLLADILAPKLVNKPQPRRSPRPLSAGAAAAAAGRAPKASIRDFRSPFPGGRADAAAARNSYA